MSADLLSQDPVYAKRYRKLLDQLIAIGIEKIIDVPKVVVVGSQSAGKSSILEALSGITFPRASGTCTRCPSEVRLFSSNDGWGCTVSLRLEKDGKGNRLDKVEVVPFGPPIVDPGEVQARLLQAQKAILNPSKSFQSFLKEAPSINCDNGRANNEIQFSENVICIDVKGKNLRDLSVIDLPGIIANVGEDEDERNIDLIRNLAKKEIAKENSIILLCISMNEDFQNQPSVTLAREADPLGVRTLGVLTKPDRVEEGTFSIWKPVLEGQEQRLHHGYYVVKNPDPKHLGRLSWEEARADEKAFFREEPWMSLSNDITYRLGAIHLAAKLATLLEKVITAKVPDIIKEVKALDLEVKAEINRLPEKVNEDRVLLHFSSLIADFDTDFKHELLGSQEGGCLADDLYTISLDFWADMINHRPRFLPLTTSELYHLVTLTPDDTPNGLKKMLQVRDYIFDEDKAELKARGVSKQGELGDADGKSLVRLLLDATKSTTLYGSTLSSAAAVEEVLLLTLSDIQQTKARASRDLLQCNTTSDIKARTIAKCVEGWTSITSHAIKKIENRLLDECERLIARHFSRFQIGGLDSAAGSIMKKLIAERITKTEAFVADLVTLESRYTSIGTDGVKRRQEAMKKDLLDARSACYMHNEAQDTVIRLEENVEDELNLVAEIRAHWQIVYRRYTDNVRSAFSAFLLHPIATDCLGTLKSELGIADDDALSKVQTFLQEDHITIQRRMELLTRQTTLKESLEIISAFWTGGTKSDGSERTPKRAKHHH